MSDTRTLDDVRAPMAAEALETLADPVRRDGFAFLRAAEMRAVLLPAGLHDWDSFAASWNDLGIDQHMADGGRYRRRRHAVFTASAEAITRAPARPHYQGLEYNALNGGIARWFEPVQDAIADHPAMIAILATCRALFTALTPAAERPASWHVEIHQFRIEARAGAEGRPTPEGMHRDGVDWVLVLLVRRENIASGTTTIHDLGLEPRGSFTLAAPLDSAVVDDSRVYHGVTAVSPIDPDAPAFRDVLVVTFRSA